MSLIDDAFKVARTGLRDPELLDARMVLAVAVLQQRSCRHTGVGLTVENSVLMVFPAESMHLMSVVPGEFWDEHGERLREVYDRLGESYEVLDGRVLFPEKQEKTDG